MKRGPKIDLIGQKFNHLTVVGYNGDGRWDCLCDCGKHASVSASHLKKERTISCGCQRIRKMLEKSTTHGKSYSSEYQSWARARSRTVYPKDISYKNYGGRGIKMCDRWLHSFANFYSDMGPKPGPEYTLDRYPDVNGDYEPTNCRWATDEQQRRNRTDNRWLEYGGVKLIMEDWAKRLNMDVRNLHRELKSRDFSKIVQKRIKDKKYVHSA